MGRWNPWRELRKREHIDFRIAPLPFGLRGVYWPRGERTAIVLSPTLTRAERNAALAHELVHDERGGGCAHAPELPDALADLGRREEARVHRIAAERLVPLMELVTLVSTILELGEDVTAARVADEFDTTEAVAHEALSLIRFEESQ